MIKGVIENVMEFIKGQMNDYIKIQAQENELVKISALILSNGNIVQEDQICLSLVKIEEENLIGKYPHFLKGSDGNDRKLKPPVSINLLLLFSATHKEYMTALSAISFVIGFFQTHHVFDAQNYPDFNDKLSLKSNQFVEKLIFEYYNLTMEQHNNLWASIGAKYLPSVLYKMRMLTFFDQQGEDTIPIKEINGETKLMK
ncbi:MAG: DUF4255 domain-containing protein [Microscillaceae bacterium]|nr:DUF4255 domain-containing protein [Microscillaceae bacterium]